MSAIHDDDTKGKKEKKEKKEGKKRKEDINSKLKLIEVEHYSNKRDMASVEKFNDFEYIYIYIKYIYIKKLHTCRQKKS